MNTIISSLNHFEHFIINHSKIKPICCSAKKSVTLLIFFIFRAAIVRRGENGTTLCELVTIILYPKVIIPVSWTPSNPIINCVLFFSLNECHFFSEFKLQQERTKRRIRNIITLFITLPFKTSKCGDCSVEFSSDNGHCIRDIIAVFMECSSLKIVL